MRCAIALSWALISSDDIELRGVNRSLPALALERLLTFLLRQLVLPIALGARHRPAVRAVRARNRAARSDGRRVWLIGAHVLDRRRRLDHFIRVGGRFGDGE